MTAISNNPLLGTPRPKVNSVVLFITNTFLWGSCTGLAGVLFFDWWGEVGFNQLYVMAVLITILIIAAAASFRLTNKRKSWDAIHRVTNLREVNTSVVDLFYVALEYDGKNIPMTYAYIQTSNDLLQIHPSAQKGLPSGLDVVGNWILTIGEDGTQTKIVDWKVVQKILVSSEKNGSTIDNRINPSGKGILNAKYTGEFPSNTNNQKKFLKDAKQTLGVKEDFCKVVSLKQTDDQWELVAQERQRKLSFYFEVNEQLIPVSFAQFKTIPVGSKLQFTANLQKGQSEIQLI